MVGRDMVARARPVLGALLALLLVLAPAMAVVGDLGLLESATSAAVASIGDDVPADAVALHRTPRPAVPSILVLAAAALVVLLLAPLVRVRRAGERRRLDDVGDGWRALLLGAPPARA
jgi:hypothetical protein